MYIYLPLYIVSISCIHRALFIYIPLFVSNRSEVLYNALNDVYTVAKVVVQSIMHDGWSTMLATVEVSIQLAIC